MYCKSNDTVHFNCQLVRLCVTMLWKVFPLWIFDTLFPPPFVSWEYLGIEIHCNNIVVSLSWIGISVRDLKDLIFLCGVQKLAKPNLIS